MQHLGSGAHRGRLCRYSALQSNILQKGVISWGLPRHQEVHGCQIPHKTARRAFERAYVAVGIPEPQLWTEVQIRQLHVRGHLAMCNPILRNKNRSMAAPQKKRAQNSFDWSPLCKRSEHKTPLTGLPVNAHRNLDDGARKRLLFAILNRPFSFRQLPLGETLEAQALNPPLNPTYDPSKSNRTSSPKRALKHELLKVKYYTRR